MDTGAPHDTPSTVTAEQGEVQVDGPGGLATALTPDAAEETGNRLLKAAPVARGQRGSATPEGAA
jgi:putative intracellular protease/amidase